MSLKNIWPYCVLSLLWLIIILWLYNEQQSQEKHSKESIKARGHIFIETLASNLRTQSKLKQYCPKHLQEIIKGVIITPGVIALALIDKQGDIVAASGNKEKLILKLPQKHMEYWHKKTLQLWSLVKIGKMPWNWKKKKCNNIFCKCDKKCKRGERYCRRVREVYLTILLPIGSMNNINNSTRRIRYIVVIMSFILILVVSLVWHKNVKEISLRSSLILAKEQNKHLHEMNLAASGLAHETKNPLNTVRMATQTLSTMSPESKKWDEMLSLIINEVDRLSARINQWLTYSKPIITKCTKVDIDMVFKELHSLVSFDAEEKNVTIDIAPSGFFVSADKEMLRQLLFNILLNAIQAVSEQGKIRVELTKTASKASIIIKDNGAGVALDIKEQIFAPYFTTKECGTGLGLAICKKIAFSHRWKIFYKKNEPHGAQFIIEGIDIVG